MWFSFWRSRDRFSLDELRYLTDQLMKVQVVNDVNKDFVIEALRSIAELITYGDQHDPAFFDFFMEKQVMGTFVRILKVSRTLVVSLQLLQTMSIMIQNLRSEHSIYYMFSNEHINYLITYSFDFHNEELLSYYISFLRAISGKLNKNTISLLVKTHDDDVVSFPLYVEAIKFAFHEEGMIRIAVRALTLNVYHVGDEAVNRYVASAPHADYFVNLVTFFREQCISLSRLVSNATMTPGSDSCSLILSAVEEIEDNLYYFSDVISAGIPDVGKLITDNILKLLIFPLILPSLRMVSEIGVSSSLYLLCCLLRIVKIKDLANTVGAALLFHIDTFSPGDEAKLNGHSLGHGTTGACANSKDMDLRDATPSVSSTSQVNSGDTLHHGHCGSYTLREALLSFITDGDDVQASGSLSVLATLLQTKELDEPMLDALGILPQRKQHKKLLLQALVGEGSEEELLFSSGYYAIKDELGSEFDSYAKKLKDEYGASCVRMEAGTSAHSHRTEVLDALVSLFCRSNISSETLWDGGWLLRQLLPYSETEFNSSHLESLRVSLHQCCRRVLDETKGTWPDMLIKVLFDEWSRCKRANEASSPRKDPKCILLPQCSLNSEELFSSESSFLAGERMCEVVKAFVLLHQLHMFSIGNIIPEQPPVRVQSDVTQNIRAKQAGIGSLSPKPSSEIKVGDALPCRIAFERGKERHFCFLSVSSGTSGWIILAEELPLKPGCGIVRVVAPLAGCNPRIDDKHPRWLHLRIRPSAFPFADSAKYNTIGKVKTRAFVDGRWTLAFRDEATCMASLSMILEEMQLQSKAVEERLQPLLDPDTIIKDSLLASS
ncbi:OLC1v1036096C1 [Oldenlandia corymbosa var. corymbosa]|uniref:OLC1v1036096C1 n=1 Tax=Oldenlandia corymbosa var. corymbosa TaxID=529605 RepID=A0AAV1CVA6_OLDCO|nr:OLC1v1036096C1 [Oldenlandia corymbosa var. corymbosa]